VFNFALPLDFQFAIQFFEALFNHTLNGREMLRIGIPDLLEPGLTIAEVNRRIAALKHSMAQEIERPDISILTTGATPA
jgi:hypothetical protein